MGGSFSFKLNNVKLACGTLQAMVNSLEKKIDETEKRFEESSKISEERLKQALDAENKIIELKTAMQRSLCVYYIFPSCMT